MRTYNLNKKGKVNFINFLKKNYKKEILQKKMLSRDNFNYELEKAESDLGTTQSYEISQLQTKSGKPEFYVFEESEIEIHEYFDLILHDFGNLANQLVTTSENKHDLKRMAENLNHMFAQAGLAKQFEAAVYE